MNKTFKESNYDQIVCCYAAKDWFITEKLNQEGIDELVAKLSEVLKEEEKDEVLSKIVSFDEMVKFWDKNEDFKFGTALKHVVLFYPNWKLKTPAKNAEQE